MADWPTSLPSQFEVGAQLTQQTGFIRSPTDRGPFKQRRRFTSVSRFYEGSLLLTAAQKATLETFYHDTVKEGSDTFNFEDPADTSSTVSARFMVPPSYQLLVGGSSAVALSRASISLELLA